MVVVVVALSYLLANQCNAFQFVAYGKMDHVLYIGAVFKNYKNSAIKNVLHDYVKRQKYFLHSIVPIRKN